MSLEDEIEVLRQLIIDNVSSKTDPNSISPNDVGDVFQMVADLLERIPTDSSYFPAWSPSETYEVGERVTRNKSFFVSKENGNFNNDPLTSTSKWDSLGDVLVKNITVQLGTDGSVGGINTGDVFPQGTSFQELMERLLRRETPPDYEPPVLTLNSSVPVTGYEVGESVVLNLVSLFSQNDAGAKVTEVITKNGVTVSTSNSFTETLVLTDSPIQYRSKVDYSQGPCKPNNIGEVDCTGRIPAGTVFSNIITFQGQRRVFWGFPVDVPTTSEQVRTLGHSALGSFSEFNIPIPAGSPKVIFAVRGDVGLVKSVGYVELGGAEVILNFTRTTVNVESAGGGSSVPYNVYTYTPVEPFNRPVNYLVIF